MRATLAGSAGSSRISCLSRVEPSAREQNPQPRVQRLPRIMKVAAPRWKHSWMLGQRADSHTVCRFSSPQVRASGGSAIRNACGPCAPTRAGAAARRPLECWHRGWTSSSLTIFAPVGWNPALSRSGLGLAQCRRVRVRAHQHADQVVRARAERRRETLVLAASAQITSAVAVASPPSPAR